MPEDVTCGLVPAPLAERLWEYGCTVKHLSVGYVVEHYGKFLTFSPTLDGVWALLETEEETEREARRLAKMMPRL
jgi:hypothetical protein